MHTSPLITWTILKRVHCKVKKNFFLWSQNLIKLIMPLHQRHPKVKLNTTIHRIRYHWLDHNKVPAVLSTMLLYQWCQYQHSERGKRCLSIITKVVLTFQILPEWA